MCYCLSVGKFPTRNKKESWAIKVKFVIRRAVVGLMALPVVAGTYVFIYVLLGSLGNGLTVSLNTVWDNGLLIGSVSAVAFAFATQIDKLMARLVGE